MTEVSTPSLCSSLAFKEHNRTLVLYLPARLRDEQLAKEVAQEAKLAFKR